MKKILLSAGHSNTDPGSCANGFREADIAVEMRNIVSFYLNQSKVPHVLDGKGTENLPLTTAIQLGRSTDIDIEFHCNAHVNISATGTEVICLPRDQGLAKSLSKGISSVLGIKDRGWKDQSKTARGKLGFVQAGGLIVELFFITNRTDLDRYQGKKWLVGQAVSRILVSAAKG